MKGFKNLKIALKLLIGFAIVALIAGAVGIVGFVGMNGIYTSGEKIAEDRLPSIQALGAIKEAQTAALAGERYLINRRLMEEEVRQANFDFITSAYARADAAWDIFSKLPMTQKEAELWNNFIPQWDEWKKVQKIVIDAQKDKDQLLAGGATEDDERVIKIDDESLQQSLDARAAYLAASKTLDELLTLNVDAAASDEKSADSIASKAELVLVVVVIAGMLIAVLLGIIISRIITAPIRILTDTAEKIALGNVNIDIKADTTDEIGLLMGSFSKMIANIREQAGVIEKMATGDLTAQIQVKSQDDLLGKKLSEMLEMNNEVLNNINAAAEQVASGAKQVADSSIALSHGATEQASSVEELTASIEEISSQTEQNANSANRANSLAETAKNNAIQGNDQMKEMMKAIEDINESSTNISKIIKVIDEIAFQTNILALNAAVEAARAGQHGKGFAVVAEEVRNLAARSAKAAKETTDMIEGSIKKVEVGTKIASETANALTKIVGDIAAIASLVSDISVSSNEQSVGISQVSQGIVQVSNVVQTNSATSEESAAASEELSSQAELLKEQVSRFKLKKRAQQSYYKNLDGLSPDILAILESINHGSRGNSTNKVKANNNEKEGLHRISLTDNEFGKY